MSSSVRSTEEAGVFGSLDAAPGRVEALAHFAPRGVRADPLLDEDGTVQLVAFHLFAGIEDGCIPVQIGVAAEAALFKAAGK